MGSTGTVQAKDGHELSTYIARPQGPVKGGIVVVQEIFGVNAHIRSIADSFAEKGYVAIAPALFDRVERGIELSYAPEEMKRAFELYGRLDPATALLDVAAAFQQVEREGSGAAVLGFCFGGLMAWLSATRGATCGMTPRCTVGYYAGGVGRFVTEDPLCPVMLHFGAEDSHIGPDQIHAVQAAHPEVEVFVYEGAGHAFNRAPDPGSYRPEVARLAGERTLAFLAKHLS